jgi:hypothetical protein
MIRDPDSPASFDLAAAFGRHQPGRYRDGRVMPTHPPLHHGEGDLGISLESSGRAAAHLCLAESATVVSRVVRAVRSPSFVQSGVWERGGRAV